MADDNKDVDMGDSDDDSSSEEEVDIDPQDEQRIMSLEAQLEASPTVYDLHVQLLELLRKCKLKARLQSARQRMHELYPFNENQWMEWINDEMESVSSQEDIVRIKQLFQQATQDYVSIALWESYLEFLQAADPEVSSKTPAGAELFRQAAEAALTAAGLHLAEGHHLWQAYRSYEQTLLEEAPSEKQVERVRNLYHRQLQLPNLEAAELLQEYEQWETQHGKGSVPDHIRAAAQRSSSAAQLRSAHEAAVSTDKAADATLLAAYMAYIQLEKAQKDPARVQLLYERAVSVFPVTSELWLQYTRYLETELKVPALINKVYARAVRNCPWVGALWSAALRAHERYGGPDSEHEAMAAKALAAGMQGPEDYLAVLLARADCLRHQLPSPPVANDPVAVKLRSWFQHSCSTMKQYFPDHLDRSLRLQAYWAHVEGVVLGDLAAMRAVWEDMVKGQLGRYYETWLAWIHMERSVRQIPAARALFRRCYSRNFEEGGQLALAYEWIKFEREEGSAEDLFTANFKVESIIEGATAAAAAAANQPEAAVARAAAHNAQKLSREEVKAKRRAHDPNFKERRPGVKRDLGSSSNAAAGAEPGASSPQKRTRAAADQDATMADATDAGFDAAAAAAKQPVVFTDEHTVFVKGLGYDVGEEDLRRLFAELGVKSVRMGKDKFTGALRGFAYVDFETDDAVHKASQKDGEVINGRKLFIAKSQPPGGSRGRGRGPAGGRGGRGGRGAADEGHFEGGGRGGHGERGRGGGGRGRFGLGFVKDDVPSAAHGNMGHMRHHLDVGKDKPGARMPQLVPRALLAKQPAGQQQSAAAGSQGQPRSNEDFRKLLLQKK